MNLIINWTNILAAAMVVTFKSFICYSDFGYTAICWFIGWVGAAAIISIILHLCFPGVERSNEPGHIWIFFHTRYSIKKHREKRPNDRRTDTQILARYNLASDFTIGVVGLLLALSFWAIQTICGGSTGASQSTTATNIPTQTPVPTSSEL